MPYSNRSVLSKNYYPSDSNIITDATVYAIDTETEKTVAEFLLQQSITSESRLRFKFEIRQVATDGAHPVYALWKKNGVTIGTQQSADSDAWHAFSEDIDVGFAVGDSLKVNTFHAAAGPHGEIKNIEIDGTDSIWREV